jgi:parallel beta-helix repeat protein
MAVNLSPVGGVAAQFFTNTGAVLTGGKLYTYLAGTTTPAAAYTSSSGATAWTNPIVLDAAGRVSGSGEIWLTDGIIYKFVLKDTNDVLIATYDNVTGINSNSVAYTNQQQIITATAGQTVFNLSISYQPGTNSLSVFVDGVNQYGPGASYAYTETDADTVTFVSGLHVGAEVKFTTTQQQGAGAVDASQVSYTPAGVGAVTTNVQAKLRQYVSVKDFGAVGDGTTDDTAAIQAALTAVAATEGAIYIPTGQYLVSSSLIIGGVGVSVFGDGAGSVIKVNAPVTVFSSIDYGNHTFRDFTIDGSLASTVGFSAGRGAILIQSTSIVETNVSSLIENVRILEVKTSGIVSDYFSHVTAQNNYIYRSYEHSFYSAQYIINNIVIESGYGSGTSHLSVKHQDMPLGEIIGNSFINPTNVCIQVQGATGAYGTTITDNRFITNTANFAINIASGTEIGTIENNYFVQSVAATAINIGGGSKHSICGNKFALVNGSVAIDIAGAYNLQNAIICNNVFADSGTGDVLTLRNSSSNNLISNNTFINASIGIVFQASTSSNIAISNIFSSVTTPIVDSGTNNIGSATTAASTGVGSVKMGSANNANNAVWIPVKYANTTYYVPAWTDATP